MNTGEMGEWTGRDTLDSKPGNAIETGGDLKMGGAQDSQSPTTDSPGAALTTAQRANIARWVQTLRSGEYEQGRGRLRTGDRFCCLGVACDLVKGDVGEDWDGLSPLVYHFGGYDVIMPPEVAGLYGLHGAGLLVREIDNPGALRLLTLGALNDAGYSFAQIADVIEDQFLGGASGSPPGSPTQEGQEVVDRPKEDQS